MKLTFALCPVTLVLSVVTAAAQPSHPRTPWRDPDLQGYYTNKYEYGTPFERPAAFAGKNVTDLSAQELAALAKQRQQEAADRERSGEGSQSR